MSNLQVAENIANLIGGRALITQLMSPKHLMGGENSLGIRLKKQNKNKINHIEITINDNAYTVDFWAFPKDFMDNVKVASHVVTADQLKATIAKETNFVFPTGNAEKNKEIADTIISQLGGYGALNCMIGVDSTLPIENGVRLMFKIKIDSGINGFEIVLNNSDLYDVKFIKATASKTTVVSENKGLYFDMLRAQIEETTGLSLIVPRITRMAS
jgi:hypothetical protein